MKRCILIVVLLLSISGVDLSAQRKNQAYLEYIDTYKSLAIKQQNKYGIPASITLAQGLLESGAGRSTLARESNNHFGIKCHDDWRGERVYHDDDKENECFRKYKKPEESYEDHSLFLKRPRYASLFDLKPTNYKGWAKGLSACGYATDKGYADKLINIIELYGLDQYDSSDCQEKSPVQEEELTPVENVEPANRLWGLLYVEVKAGYTLKMIAKESGVSVRKLAKYNEISKDYPLKAGDIIYLEKKHKKAQEGTNSCMIQEGDSMHSIAQRYGMQVKTLYKLNRLSKDYTPVVGDVLRLR